MNKLFAIIVSCFLLFPAYAIEQETGIAPANEAGIEEISPDESAALNENSPEYESVLPSPYKEPVSKKALIKKLLIAMLCVVASSVFIFAALTVYNKIRTGIVDSDIPVQPEEEKELKAPIDLIEAVKSFLERTKW